MAGSGRQRRGCCRIASPGWRLARRQLDRGVEARGADEVIRHLAVPGLRAADHSLGSPAAFTVRAVDLYGGSDHAIRRSRLKRKQGAEASTQYGGLSRRKHERQLVGESFTLSLNDSAIFLRFFRAIDYLDRLPRCNVPILS